MRFAVKVNTYSDNDGNRIVTPVTSVEGDAGPHVTLHAQVLFDVMTCASVDVVSSATQKGHFKETREQYDGGLVVHWGAWSLSAATSFSRENDYRSVTGTLGLGVELFQRNTSLTLGYGFSDSDVGRASDPLFERDLDSHTVTASLTQVLSSNVVLQVGYFLGALSGYQGSPYRNVAIGGGTSAPESAPTWRLRQALVARVKASLSSSWFLGADYRFYFDTWGIDSHTAELALTHEPVRWFSWRLRDRFYLQDGADFYQEVYDTRRRYMTSDRELGPFLSNLVGLKLVFVPPDILKRVGTSIDLKFDFTWQRFSQFSRLSERLMYVAEAGLRVEF